MFDTNNEVKTETRDTSSDHGSVHRGLVLSRGPLNPVGDPTKVPADTEPRITVEPESGNAPTEVVVTRSYARSTGVPTIGQNVYYILTTNDRRILLGVTPTEHSAYTDERRIPHPHSDAHAVFNKDGSITTVTDAGTTVELTNDTATVETATGTTVTISNGDITLNGVSLVTQDDLDAHENDSNAHHTKTSPQ